MEKLSVNQLVGSQNVHNTPNARNRNEKSTFAYRLMSSQRLAVLQMQGPIVRNEKTVIWYHPLMFEKLKVYDSQRNRNCLAASMIV